MKKMIGSADVVMRQRANLLVAGVCLLIPGETLVITTLDRLARFPQNMISFTTKPLGPDAAQRVLNLRGRLRLVTDGQIRKVVRLIPAGQPAAQPVRDLRIAGATFCTLSRPLTG